MIELAKLKIEVADPRVKNMPLVEIDEKIELIYSLGYIYDPYRKHFLNPFIDRALKVTVVYNLNLESIKKLHMHLKNEYLKDSKHLKRFEEIKRSIYKKDKISRLEIFLDSMSGILGFVLLIGTIIFDILGKIEISTGLLLGSFILINYYLVYNLLFAQNEEE